MKVLFIAILKTNINYWCIYLLGIGVGWNINWFLLPQILLIQKKNSEKAITIVTEKVADDSNTEHINEAILNKIIIAEFTKTLHTKEVDQENKEGFFLIYKRVINRIVAIVNEVNPTILLQNLWYQQLLKAVYTNIF